MKVGNLFENALPPSDGERFETLLAAKNLVIERIVSSSKIASTEYVQPQDEWVLLLQGNAVLVVAGKTVHLKSGDYLFLPSGTPHTVQSVSEGAVWLAIHLHEKNAQTCATTSQTTCI
ncbi:MAG: cupin domain-containing protein [Victivallales bacterium]